MLQATYSKQLNEQFRRRSTRLPSHIIAHFDKIAPCRKLVKKFLVCNGVMLTRPLLKSGITLIRSYLSSDF
jgi:hypothetical protein